MNFFDVADRLLAGLDAGQEIRPQLLDVLTVGLIQLRILVDRLLVLVVRIERPAVQPALVERAFSAVEVAADRLVDVRLLGLVAAKLAVLPRNIERLELELRDLMIRRVAG